MLLFRDVCAAFDVIESKSGRLEMTDLLAELFKKCTPKEAAYLCYLIQGIIAPPYEGIDLGMGERFALAAIASATGYPSFEVEKHFKKSGDLGDTATEFSKKKKQLSLLSNDLSLEYVFETFQKISKASGSGSQELKIKLLVELLNNSDPLEARYIIRFVNGSLRLGVGDPTILDAISVSHAGNKSMREQLERAYNVCSDLGLIAKSFFTSPSSIASFHVSPFKPLMPALAERLNTPKEIIEKLGECIVENKYDGFRMQCHKSGDRVEMYSRKLERMTPMLPEVVEAIRNLPQKEIIFEGEALAYDVSKKRYLPFQQTMHRRRKHGIEAASKDYPLRVFVFDILYLDGKDMTDAPYADRRKTIEKLFLKGKLLMPSEAKKLKTATALEAVFDASLSAGLEGIIAKDLAAPYAAGKRKFAWIKLKKSYGKSVDTIDGVIVGYYLGLGQRAEFEFGGVLVCVYNPQSGKLETVAKVASGFSESEMKQMQELLSRIKTPKPPANLDCKIAVDFWVEPKYVVEVAFDELTQSPNHTCNSKGGKGLALRFPRVVKLREDKGLSEITTSDEVVSMFELQRGK
ncbi:ATP-dependent DNA ligase [Candidatus Micrarchaeota archaeon]|nr:ATP-dependent DNA ligase [Candidatus Micrarchaeota archaeon]